MTCQSGNTSAQTSYWCAATNQSVHVSVLGPGLCGQAPSPTPTPAPTPCTAQAGDTCFDYTDCCWNQTCDQSESKCVFLLVATQGQCESAGLTWNFTTNTCQNPGAPTPTPTPAPTPTPPSGDCPEFLTRLTKSSGKNSAPNLINPYCCDPLEQWGCDTGGGEWNNFTCTCLSPIVVDVAGNGFNLTSAAGGVFFDIVGTGVAEQISWTAANSDDAWLALDRNGNGIVDNGKELFGSSTEQPLVRGEWKHGFRALAMFDTAAYGGNEDGLIDNRDGVFFSLKLWQDRNHNGFSEADELQNLSGSVINVIHLKYKESRHKDENGNWFRYRAKVTDSSGAQVGRWAWDVFVQKPH